MAVWLEGPGDYRCVCPHCGWTARTRVLAVATHEMALHGETECRWWESRHHVFSASPGRIVELPKVEPDPLEQAREDVQPAAALTAAAAV